VTEAPTLLEGNATSISCRSEKGKELYSLDYGDERNDRDDCCSVAHRQNDDSNREIDENGDEVEEQQLEELSHLECRSSAEISTSLGRRAAHIVDRIRSTENSEKFTSSSPLMIAQTQATQKERRIRKRSDLAEGERTHFRRVSNAIIDISSSEY
jgi:hypothetical protein